MHKISRMCRHFWSLPGPFPFLPESVRSCASSTVISLMLSDAPHVGDGFVQVVRVTVHGVLQDIHKLAPAMPAPSGSAPGGFDFGAVLHQDRTM
jgi:hypothetical protein